MSILVSTAWNVVAKAVRGNMKSRLVAAGLKLDDLIIESPEMLKALDRVPREQQLERERRIKRAFDLSAKRKTLPAEYAPSDVYESYLQRPMARVEAEEEERKILNGY